MSDKYPGWSPFAYCHNSPILLIDPNGMEDEVVVTGPDADKVVASLNESSSLSICKDDNGKLSATGEPKSESDKLLLEAINSDKVTININTTNDTEYDSKDGTKGIFIAPASFDGSEWKPGGKVEVNRYLNFETAQNMAGIIGEKVGETITHEMNEGYIAGRDYPGCDYINSYPQSHKGAAAVDRVDVSGFETNRDYKSSPGYIILQGRMNSQSPWQYITKMRR